MGQSDYIPPFKRQIGPHVVEYGPRSAGECERRWKAWKESRAGGALWDDETQEEITQRKKRRRVRYDYEQIAAYVERRGASLPRRELETFFCYWEDGRSMTACCHQMEIQRSTLREFIKRLRRGARK